MGLKLGILLKSAKCWFYKCVYTTTSCRNLVLIKCAGKLLAWRIIKVDIFCLSALRPLLFICLFV